MSENTWEEAIVKVLRESLIPLHYNDITERIISNCLLKTVGATPSRTVNAIISKSIKNDGNNSPFVRVYKGVYTIKNEISDTSVIAGKQTQTIDEEEQYEIISSFGMFWRRKEVEWKLSPKLLGMQHIGSESVDFCNQLGIYLLYDGREVIYVGRTTDRPLGRRLYEHTIDRLTDRWDRFSWFGLCPVSEEGLLATLPNQYDSAVIIPALEAILIEALEPRQNRKRGDDLAAVEYLQIVDPNIERQRALAIFAKMFLVKQT